MSSGFERRWKPRVFSRTAAVCRAVSGVVNATASTAVTKTRPLKNQMISKAEDHARRLLVHGHMHTAPSSIYAHVSGTTPASRSTRCSRRARARARVVSLDQPGPTLRLDRVTPIRRAVEAAPEQGLDEFVDRLEAEVSALEAWAEARPRPAQRDGGTIRRTLELLRRFGRLSAMDFSNVPVEDRPALVKVLALEHRWCYAAAGTTRAAFKDSTGRTGAR